MPTAARPGRNEPCHCGSGRKYKQCCLDKDESAVRAVHAKALADAPEPSADTTASAKRAPKHQTAQPWKTQTSRGAFQQVRTPRKVGGS
jgi:hypothetical protein